MTVTYTAYTRESITILYRDDAHSYRPALSCAPALILKDSLTRKVKCSIGKENSDIV